MTRNWQYVVVSLRGGKPVHVDGPYRLRRDADDVRRMLNRERDDDHEAVEYRTTDRFITVPCTRLITPREIDKWLADR